MKINLGFMQGRLSPIYNKKIQSFPYDHWKQEFEKAYKLGFNTMEWTIDHKNLYKNPLMYSDGQKQIKLLKEKFHIRIPSLTGDCFMQMPFWKKKHERKVLQKNFVDIISNCKKIGIRMIVVPLVDNGKLENKFEKKILVEFLNKISFFLKKKKIQILFESDFDPKKYLMFLKNFDHKIFGVNYDTGNSASLGFNPIEEIESYGKYIKNVHIKDRKFNGPSVPLGYGKADLKLILNLLSLINYKGNLILQTARSKNNQHSKTLLKYSNYIKNLIFN